MRQLVLCGVAMTLTTSAWAQQVTVQQPVIGTFSTATTVSVPDRGTIVLGGVGSAASGRTTTGPFRSGSSLGLERQSSSMSAGVYIHDLHAMDEALLATGIADDAAGIAEYSARLNSRFGRLAEPRSSAKATSTERVDAESEARRFEALARAAEAKGKPSVAKLHWQMAAKHGSKLAQQSLTQMQPPSKTTAQADVGR